MSEYQYTVTETEEEHAERVGEDLTEESISWCATCNKEATDECQKHKQAIVVESVIIICSCGHATCSMVTKYGHPIPVFVDVIEPIPTQYARDVRALELRGERDAADRAAKKAAGGAS